MFRFIEPSSGQFLNQSNGTFRECEQYCLHSILTLKFMLNKKNNFNVKMVCKQHGIK
jgi:hypothetical protein